ncbi:MAG: hypothetical protein REJ23_00485 [Brevundimonas sp.]|nr:hypothetical protein [Brevundimonas sp.]
MQGHLDAPRKQSLLSSSASNNQPNSQSYAPRFVAFVDILGFADLVRRANHEPVLRGQIIEALQKVRTTSAPGSGDTDLRVQNFSDSLILSSLPTATGLWHLLLSLDALAWNLLQIGVLVRGGVAMGGMHHDDEIVFGVGVIDAYRLESSVAKYPRIIISKTVLAKTQEFASDDEVWDALKAARLRRDSDGVWFLHYLNDIAAANAHPRGTPQPGTDFWYDCGVSIQRIIQGMLEETVDSPDVYAKVHWLGDYWNREVVGHQTWDDDTNFKRIVLAGNEPRPSPLPFRPKF